MSQTIIEKAKRYDEIIEEIKGLLESIREDKREILEEDITSIFPELQENEDERIRKAITEFLKKASGGFLDTTIQCEIFGKWLAWLEKQGDKDELIKELGEYKAKYTQEVLEKHLRVMNKDNERLRKTTISFLKDFADKGYENAVECIDWLEKQSEQKSQGKSALEAINEEKVDNQFCVKPVDKVEPKFNVGDIIVNIHYRWDGRHKIRKIVDGKYIFDDGSCIKIKEQNNWELLTNKDERKFHTKDWIVFNKNKIIFQIKSYNSGYCTLEDIKGKTYSPCMPPTKEDYHLWTIQDAKPGDILASKDGKSILIFRHFSLDDDDTFASYYSITFSSYYYMQGYDEHNWLSTNFVPATKEQRDLLFQKMKEAGYEWDVDKKELKKIENEIEIPYGAKDSELMEVSYNIPKGFHAEIDDDKVVIKKGEKPTWSEKHIADVFEKVGLAKIAREQSNDNLTIALQDAMIELSKVTLQPNPTAWSKEDENLLELSFENLTELKDRFGKDYGRIGDCINWLKSLKGRVQPQPKQKCSEWDRSKIQRICKYLDEAKKYYTDITEVRECIDWLKFLRPQYIWQPSDEQMTQLGKYCPDNRPLTSLYEQLKKLKGE